MIFFFFSSRRRHTRFSRDWSSDVCSSDLSQIRADLFISMSSSQQIYGHPSADSEWTNHSYATYLLLKPHTIATAVESKRSEERRVGKEWISRWSTDH